MNICGVASLRLFYGFRVSGVRCQVSGQRLAATVQSDRERNFWGSAPKSTIVGFRFLQ
ncbi:hypothetical protein D1AOALGA4SA_5688 [Olavius algarvensis Delta 1 endosymbiont]|nr:hypothetical protein D1AOALGA4SA_5688 [Olavius algarvensis Delta 1 endosymbiont]